MALAKCVLFSPSRCASRFIDWTKASSVPATASASAAPAEGSSRFQVDWTVSKPPADNARSTVCAWSGLHRAAIAGGLPSPPEARERLDRAIALRPNLDQAQVFLGNLRKADGDIPGAERCFRRAVEINPDCKEAWQELRVIEMRRDKGRG